MVENIRQRHGRVAGLIHLHPLTRGRSIEAMALRDWRERLDLEVTCLFALVQAAAADLRAAGRGGGGVVFAGTAMGGSFGFEVAAGKAWAPSQGGVGGFLKTLAVEWPEVRCQVVDLDPEASVESLVEQLWREFGAADGEVETGCREGRRLVFRPRAVPLEPTRPAGVSLGADSVVLITGGARGITAEVACELAQRYRPTLLLVGRAPVPPAVEAPETAQYDSAKDLKAALMERRKGRGESLTPAAVERAYQELMREREIRRNLETMKQAGATVRYFAVDVREETAFGNLIDELYRSHGRLDGVIHGAGIIEDKLVEDKTLESFDRVFGTKVASAFVLSRKLRADSLRFLVLFSSVSGCFGNRGQGDYAAANAVLNKLAQYLDQRWPGRVVALNWGPWQKAGMVTEAVKRQFAQRAVQLIEPAAGRWALDRELRLGQKAEVEVVLGNGPWGNPSEARPGNPHLGVGTIEPQQRLVGSRV
jgi:NAD(P)-dependent dehydrogenase (short-subunit alcohol dehydrogenase family)